MDRADIRSSVELRAHRRRRRVRRAGPAAGRRVGFRRIERRRVAGHAAGDGPLRLLRRRACVSTAGWSAAGSGGRRSVDGEWRLHSHVIGFLDGYRALGLGARDQAPPSATSPAPQGLDAFEWTYDPLHAANARFNLAKLGARVLSFHHDFYGELKDVVQRAASAPIGSSSGGASTTSRHRRATTSARTRRLPRRSSTPEPTADRSSTDATSGRGVAARIPRRHRRPARQRQGDGHRCARCVRGHRGCGDRGAAPRCSASARLPQTIAPRGADRRDARSGLAGQQHLPRRPRARRSSRPVPSARRSGGRRTWSCRRRRTDRSTASSCIQPARHEGARDRRCRGGGRRGRRRSASGSGPWV